MTDASSAAIRFTRSDGTSGSFPATVIDPESGTIGHDLATGELDQVGWWIFWAYVVFDDGRAAAGEAVRVYVRAEGSIMN